MASVLVAVAGMIGCSDWESSGDEEAWNSSYNWLDFSGIYADVGQSVLVKDASTAFDMSSELVVQERIAHADGSSFTFSDVLDHDGVVRGSVLISAGQYSLVDDRLGGLIGVGSTGGGSGGSGGIVVTETFAASGQVVNSGVIAGSPVIPGTFSIAVSSAPPTFSLSDLDADGVLSSVETPAAIGSIVYQTGAWSFQNGFAILPAGTVIRITYQQEAVDTGTGGSAVSGAISYSTGAWTITLPGIPLADGVRIYASYRYTQNTSASDVSGNTGDPIYTMTILQTGERLRIIDSNGNEFEGRLYDVNTTAGDVTQMPVTDVTSDSAGGLEGEVVASFYAEGPAFGQWVTMDGTFGGVLGASALFARQMNGTWRESGGKAGVFFGTAGSSAVPVVIGTNFINLAAGNTGVNL